MHQYRVRRGKKDRGVSVSEKNEQLRVERTNSIGMILALIFVIFVCAVFHSGVVYAISMGKEIGYERGYREALEKCQKP